MFNGRYYDGRLQSGSPPNLQLSPGHLQRVYCVQLTGATSIEWYNPEGLLVSKDDDDAVNQASNSNAYIPLTFRRYQESQGGRYECRVAGPGNTLEKLPVCIGETQMESHKCKNAHISSKS